jgi:hypothetical protein
MNFVPQSIHPVQKFLAFDTISRIKAQHVIQNWSAEESVLNSVHKRTFYFLKFNIIVIFPSTSTRIQ